ncbi:MAG TPA: aspartyl protease family protein [Rhizomicrobium sp.]
MYRIFVAAALAIMPCTALASPADILAADKAASGGAAWDGKAALSLESASTGQGLTGKQHELIDLANGRFEIDFTLGPIGGGQGYDGSRAWATEQSGTSAYQEGGDERALAINAGYCDANLWWRPDFGGAAVVDAGSKSDGGNSYDVLTVTPKDGAPFDAWFDSKTHLLARVVEKQQTSTVTTNYSDYRPEAGVVLAHRIVSGNGDAQYDSTQVLTHAAFVPAPPDSAFALPPEVVDSFIAGGAHQTTIPIRFIGNHIYGDAMVDGKGPYDFLFDTGGVNILTPTVTKQLGLTSEGAIEGSGLGAATVTSGLTKVRDLTIGKASIKDKVFVVFPLETLKPAGGLEMLGMAGYETFRRFVTRIDYAGRKLTLIDPKYFDPKNAGTPVKFTFRENDIMVPGSVDGVAGTFVIDTGSGAFIDLNTGFVEKNNFRAKYSKAIYAIGGFGVGGPSYEYVARGHELKLGDVAIPDPVVGLSTDTKGSMADPTNSGNVGNNALKRFIVTFDYGHKVMYLKPSPRRIDDVGTYDRAGMRVNLDADGFRIVYVDKGAPAETAGLKANDVIVAVDGKPARSITLPALRYRLRNDKPGTIVHFTLKNGRTVNVTLRNLI